MTRSTSTPLLADQLRAALADAAEGAATATLEVAVLAGLRAREHADDPLQASARAASAPLPTGDLAVAAEEAGDAIVAVEEDDDPGLGWDRLSALDEVCAAAAWLDRAPEVVPAVDVVVRVLHAFPEAWAPHAPAAARLLTSAPPIPGDPALAMWRAVEVAGLARDVTVEGPGEDDPIVPAVLEELGLRAAVVRLSWFDRGQALAADAGLPPPTPWRRVGGGVGVEIAVTQDDDARCVVLVSTDDGGRAPVATCDDEAVIPVRHPSGWAFPARAGAWIVTLGDVSATFVIAP